MSSCFLCGYFPDPLTQEAKRHQVNKVKRILFKLPASINPLESITWIPTQIFYVDSYFEDYATACMLILSLGRLWALSIGTSMIFKFTITFVHSIFRTCKAANVSYSKLSCCHYLRCFDIVFQRQFFLKSLHIIFIMSIIMSETFITIDSLQHLEISR